MKTTFIARLGWWHSCQNHPSGCQNSFLIDILVDRIPGCQFKLPHQVIFTDVKFFCQGIYIQFLVAVINYIAGMYSLAPEESVQSKTIFIDNPFGAAKDVYIWEPIFGMLKTNHVQLIVPARGATPAITRMFDVNYILGQKLVAGRQQTVVVDYRSQVKADEMEYVQLDYEQSTIEDFFNT